MPHLPLVLRSSGILKFSTTRGEAIPSGLKMLLPAEVSFGTQAGVGKFRTSPSFSTIL
jgi:hypothetical protein